MRQIKTRIKKLILSLFLISLPAYGQSTPEIQALEGAENSSVEIINSSNLIVNGIQRTSRNSAVKVTNILYGGHGSGTYTKIGKHYVVITAAHVVRGNVLFAIQGENGETVVGQVVYSSTTADVAILKVPRMTSRKAASFKSTENKDFEVADVVVYTGYPSAYELLTSVGMVAGYEPEYNAILLQGFAWPGSSGSGVFDSSGKLRGVVVAIGVEKTGKETRQLLETLVYIHALNENDINEIERILNSK